MKYQLDKIAFEMGQCIFRIEARNFTVLHQHSRGTKVSIEILEENQHDLDVLRELKTQILGLTKSGD